MIYQQVSRSGALPTNQNQINHPARFERRNLGLFPWA